MSREEPRRSLIPQWVWNMERRMHLIDRNDFTPHPRHQHIHEITKRQKKINK
jgi:hypothetical protein